VKDIALLSLVMFVKMEELAVITDTANKLKFERTKVATASSKKAYGEHKLAIWYAYLSVIGTVVEQPEEQHKAKPPPLREPYYENNITPENE